MNEKSEISWRRRVVAWLVLASQVLMPLAPLQAALKSETALSGKALGD